MGVPLRPGLFSLSPTVVWDPLLRVLLPAWTCLFVVVAADPVREDVVDLVLAPAVVGVTPVIAAATLGARPVPLVEGVLIEILPRGSVVVVRRAARGLTLRGRNVRRLVTYRFSPFRSYSLSFLSVKPDFICTVITFTGAEEVARSQES